MTYIQTREAHLRIAHSIAEQLTVSNFGEQRRRILDLILRLSFGCGKRTAYIPRQRDFEVVGVTEGHVKAHIDWLVGADVVTRDGCYYSLNKDYERWQVSRTEKYNPRKLGSLVGLNLKTPDPAPEDSPRFTKFVSPSLQNMGVNAYKNSKPITAGSASPKEILNKDINIKTDNQVSLSGGIPQAAVSFPEEAAEIWNQVLDRLKTQVSPANFNTWLNNTQGVACPDQTLVIKVPSVAVAQYLDTRLRSLIEKTIIDVTGRGYGVSFRCKGEL